MHEPLRNISLKDKFVFIHVPKCGGTSVSDCLNGTAANKVYEHHTAEHLNYGRYKRFLSDMGLSIKSFFVFSFVRNPYSRIYSHWKFLRKSYKQRHHLHFSNFSVHFDLLYSLRGFEDFVNCVFRHRKEYEMGARSDKHTYMGYVFMPQVFWLDYDPDQIDFLGRFESLDSDFDSVCSRLGTKLCLPFKNRTVRHVEEHIHHHTLNTVDKTNKMFHIDFDKLGYNFM